MRNKNVYQIRLGLINCLVISVIVFTTGCSKHLSATAGKAKGSNEANKKMSSTAQYSIIGTWILNKIEAPDLAAKVAMYGSQADIAQGTKTLELYQNALKGLTVTFAKDSTYQSVYNGQSDLGTWSANGAKEIHTVSKVSGNVQIYQIVSLTDSSVQAQIDESGLTVLMTFTRK